MFRQILYLSLAVLLLGMVGTAGAQFGKGNILFEYWFGGGVNDNLDNLFAHPDWPDNPHDSEWRTSLQGASQGDNYGTRARGYLYPPQSGDYTFWIATDDDGELWLSTDEDSANIVRIANIEGWVDPLVWDSTDTQVSDPIPLVAGQRYYIEARQSDGTGGDHIAVGWGGPGIGAGPTIIAGQYLSPIVRPQDLIASNPRPVDGATGVSIPLVQWDASMVAEWHDVYFGTTPNLGPADFVIRYNKFLNMYYHGAGLVPGTTYYWQINEIEADGTTIHIGPVWSFTATPLTANVPSPADGAKAVFLDAVLSWMPGSGAQSHDVYLGTDRALVEANDASVFQGNQFLLSFTPTGLQNDTTYYWRVNEKVGATTHVGPVWTFRTIPNIQITDPNLFGWWKLDEGSGTTAVDYSGHGRHATFQGGPQWVEGYDGGAVYVDGSDDYVDTGVTDNLTEWTVCCWVTSPSAPDATSPTGPVHRESNYQINWNHGDATFRGSAAMNVADTWHAASMGDLQANTWYHLCATYDGSALRAYRDGVLITTNPAPTGAPNAEGNSFKFGRHAAAAQFFEGTIDDVRLYDEALPVDEIRQVMRGDPRLAWLPSPANGSIVDIEHVLPITWSPGDGAVQHDVYLGTDEAAVEAANTSDTTGIYRIRQSGTSYTPPEELVWGQQYFWRINEVAADSSVAGGRIWSFTVSDYLIIDDFEDYNDFTNRIFYTWIDGFGYTTPAPGNPGNGTNSQVGNIDPPFAEQTIVNTGGQALVMEFNNAGNPWIAEADRTFASPQDWSRLGIQALNLMYRGLAQSPGGFSYDQATGTYTVVGHGDDIWDIADADGQGGFHDEFFYVYKALNGNGSITARVDSIEDVHDWAKAGVMIRNTLDANSEHAMLIVTPQNRVSFQYRVTAGDVSASTSGAIDSFTLPYWVRLTREGNTLTAQQSADGATWQDVTDPDNVDAPTAISLPGLNPTVYIGLPVTSHVNPSSPCTATFSNVTVTGGVAPGVFTDSLDIVEDRTFNANEPMYLVISSGAQQAILENPDPDALIQTSYQPWDIPISDLVAKGVNPAGITKMSIGVGNKQTPAVGGIGTLYVDDIRLYRPRCVPTKVQPDADLDDNCVVDYLDLGIMVGEWLDQADVDTTLTADLDDDDDVDLDDYAVLADEWLQEDLWPTP